MNEPSFSIEYLNEEILRFRDFMGDNRITPEKLELAKKALVHCYLNLDQTIPEDKRQAAGFQMNILLQEFSRRQSLRMLVA